MKKIGYTILKLVICFISLLAINVCSSNFNNEFTPTNIILFSVLFVVAPIVVFILNIKRKKIRWYIFACVIITICLSCPYYWNMVKREYNFESYLNGESKSEIIAQNVMPPRDGLGDSEIVFYEELEKINGSYYSIRMKVIYPKENFEEISKSITDNYEKTVSKLSISCVEEFYLEGNRYFAYSDYDEYKEVYAMAYSISPDDHSVSYLFFQNYYLRFMTPGAALLHNSEYDIKVID